MVKILTIVIAHLFSSASLAAHNRIQAIRHLIYCPRCSLLPSFSGSLALQIESFRSFGSDSLFAEGWIDSAHHLEIQIVADDRGAVSRLWERDCTLQRRHQKLVETAPAPGLDRKRRDELLDAACSLARSADCDEQTARPKPHRRPACSESPNDTRRSSCSFRKAEEVAQTISMSATLPAPVSTSRAFTPSHASRARFRVSAWSRATVSPAARPSPVALTRSSRHATPTSVCADQRMLRHLIPENRRRVYDVRALIETLCDEASVLELRRDFVLGMITALVRLEGHASSLIANDPMHLGGAIEVAAPIRLSRAHHVRVSRAARPCARRCGR